MECCNGGATNSQFKVILRSGSQTINFDLVEPPLNINKKFFFFFLVFAWDRTVFLPGPVEIRIITFKCHPNAHALTFNRVKPTQS